MPLRAVILFLWFAVPGSAYIEVVLGPSPAGRVLGLIASSQATPQNLANEIGRCANQYSHYPLMPRLLYVLEAYCREDPTRTGGVLEAFDTALLAERGDAAAKTIAEARRMLVDRLATPPLPPKPLAWFIHDPAISTGPPITRADLATLTLPVRRDRLGTMVDALLPTDDRRAYVREALKAALAADCGTLFDGRLAGPCNDLGIFQFQLTAIGLAFAGLHSPNGDPDVLNIYLSQDRETLQKVLDRAMNVYPPIFYHDVTVLSRWLANRPNRWQAWCDLEPGLW